MESVLEKTVFQEVAAGRHAEVVVGERIKAGLVLALIEIREAIQENTAIQRAILEREAKAHEQGMQLLKEWEETREYIDALAAKLDAQGDITAGVVTTLGQHAVLLRDLAEQKQDKGPGVDTRANFPDAG
jgi:hypothetical protein